MTRPERVNAKALSRADAAGYAAKSAPTWFNQA
jgi:hypothetical protein